ncbi:YggT family protein [Caldibacillus lycopersici]|uniref:YggT family protein n=1 Tax=Perspicuibacillus lycopersici TaxID=1325689 RepID=A0AAE3IR63_9BACI|nr:YggT family protein [Perspicuibacillus lycopersici]MCU9612183.1 YggT family protein [Perspicuibacillus lycopersici]
MGIIFDILNYALTIYLYAIIVYIFMSWIPNARGTRFGQILANICEPYLEMFRRIIPPLGMIDFSPIIALFVLRLAASGLHQVEIWLLFS